MTSFLKYKLSLFLFLIFLVRYIQETLGLHDLDPMYRQFAKVFETFRITDPHILEDIKEEKKEEPVVEFKKAPKPIDEYDDEEDEEVLLLSVLYLIRLKTMPALNIVYLVILEKTR